jgi:hypothetical protein
MAMSGCMRGICRPCQKDVPTVKFWGPYIEKIIFAVLLNKPRKQPAVLEITHGTIGAFE